MRPGGRLIALAVALFLVLSGSGVAAALWTTWATATGSVSAGGGMTQSGFAALGTVYRSGALSVTAPITVTNNGTASATYTLTLGRQAANTVTTGVRVVSWTVGSWGGGCTASTSPPSGASYTSWNDIPAYTGSLAPAASAVVCVRTSITSTQATSMAGAAMVGTLRLTSSVPSWTPVVATVEQSVADTATYPGATLYTPSTTTNPDDLVGYPHAIRLQHSGSANGQILATFERRTTNAAGTGPGTVTSPARGWVIKRSTDDGATFGDLSLITPAESPGWPYLLQPHLLELEQASGGYPAGTLLMGAVLADLTLGQTRMQVYRSTDRGVTWAHAGNVIATTSGHRAWEPHLVQLANGTIAVYYAHEGQGHGPYSQTIVHRLSTDGGTTWGAATTDWQFPSLTANLNDRPGMPTVARMGNGSYIMAVESCGFPGEHCQVRVKTSTDGLVWGTGPSDLGTRVQATSNHGVSRSPYIAWTPAGGAKGTVMLVTEEVTATPTDQSPAGNTRQTIVTNDQYGVGQWSELTAPLHWTAGGTLSGHRGAILPSVTGNSLLHLTPSWTGSGVRTAILHAQANAGVLPFTDAFTSDTAAGWQTYGGSWSAADGDYHATTTGPGDKSLFGSTAWRDYTLQADMKINAAGNSGVLLRVTDPTTGPDAHRGYFVGLDTNNGWVVLGRQDYGWTELGRQTITGGVATNTWYHLAVRVVGCAFTVSVRPVASTDAPTTFTANDWGGCLQFGQAGVRMYTAPTSWRNVTVVPAGSTTSTPAPYSDSFAGGSSAGFTTYGGTWTTNASARTYANTTGGNGEKSVNSGVTGTDYTLQGNVRIDATTGSTPRAGLLVRTTSPAWGANAFNGYFVGIDASTGALVITKHQNNATSLATSPTIAGGGVTTGAWYHLTVRVRGCAITASAQRLGVAEQTTVSATDCTLANGAIGTRVVNARATWSALTVTPG